MKLDAMDRLREQVFDSLLNTRNGYNVKKNQSAILRAVRALLRERADAAVVASRSVAYDTREKFEAAIRAAVRGKRGGRK